MSYNFDLEKRLGAIPSIWNDKNFRVRQPFLKEVADLPKEYEGLYEFAPTETWPDQGNIGSCVGWDGSIVMEITNTLLFLYAQKTHRPELLKYIQFDLSAGWLYYWSREFSEPPVPPWQEGSTNKGLMRALNHKGTALEGDVSTDTVSPWDGITYSEADEQRALQYAIDSYWMVSPLPTDIKAAIYGITHEAPYKMPDGTPGKIPLISAYPVYESFKQSYEDGIVPMPFAGEPFLGGHSSAIIGWKIIDDVEYWINFNSWGSDVGDEGLFYIPTSYPCYPADWFLIHNGPHSPPPDPEPSPCNVGATWAKIQNFFPWIGRRKGRFYYLNPR